MRIIAPNFTFRQNKSSKEEIKITRPFFFIFGDQAGKFWVWKGQFVEQNLVSHHKTRLTIFISADNSFEQYCSCDWSSFPTDSVCDRNSHCHFEILFTITHFQTKIANFTFYKLVHLPILLWIKTKKNRVESLSERLCSKLRKKL